MQEITLPSEACGILIQYQVFWGKIGTQEKGMQELVSIIMVQILDGFRIKKPQITNKLIIKKQSNKEINKSHKEQISEHTKEFTFNGREEHRRQQKSTYEQKLHTELLA